MVFLSLVYIKQVCVKKFVLGSDWLSGVNNLCYRFNSVNFSRIAFERTKLILSR